MTLPRFVTADRDAELDARVLSRQPLFYTAGADAALDRPAHVRSGSALAWLGDELLVVQDDANFLARVDLVTGAVDAITLQAGPGGVRLFDDARGNKAHKLDLEACALLPSLDGDVFVAFGSGSTEARETVVVARGVRAASPDVSLVPCHALYAALRADADFAGSELNIEGAALVGDSVRFFQRGNGAPRAGREPVDATCDVPVDALLAYLADPSRPPPAHHAVVRYDLGEVGGVRLTFTDAAPGPDGSVLYLAAAEASPDTYRDGPVSGVAVGVIDAARRARYARLRDTTGALFAAKAEGLARDPRTPRRAYVVLDHDDPDAPSELCVVDLAGPW